MDTKIEKDTVSLNDISMLYMIKHVCEYTKNKNVMYKSKEHISKDDQQICIDIELSYSYIGFHYVKDYIIYNLTKIIMNNLSIRDVACKVVNCCLCEKAYQKGIKSKDVIFQLL